jgi:primary-amine oxidase
LIRRHKAIIMAALVVKPSRIHPLKGLTSDEIKYAAAILTKIQQAKSRDSARSVRFQHITLSEPPKALLLPYLDAENAGVTLSKRPWVPRCARITWSQLNERRDCETIVSLDTELEVAHLDAKAPQHHGLDRYGSMYSEIRHHGLIQHTETRSLLQTLPFSVTPRS